MASRNSYKYTQVPSPLVQPGGSRRLLRPSSTVVIGEDRKHGEPPARSGGNGGVAPKAQKQMSRQEYERYKAGTKEVAAAGPVKKGPGKIILTVIVIIFAINVLLGIAGGMYAVVSDKLEDFGNKIEQSTNGIFDDDHVLCDDDEIVQFAWDEGYSDPYIAFFDKNGITFYYCPDDDVFIDEDQHVYCYADDGKYGYEKGKRFVEMPRPDVVLDEEYAGLAMIDDAA